MKHIRHTGRHGWPLEPRTEDEIHAALQAPSLRLWMSAAGYVYAPGDSLRPLGKGWGAEGVRRYVEGAGR